MLRPKTTGNNVRQYTQADIENVKAVYNLVKVRGFKLSAARKMLRENKQAVDGNARVMESLIKVRDELKLLKSSLIILSSIVFAIPRKITFRLCFLHMSSVACIP